MYLFDTNLLSEARRGGRVAVAWMDPVEDRDLFISVVTLGEIAKGAELKAKSDPRSSAVLVNWLQAVRRRFGGRILPVTDDIAVEWGRLEAQRPRGSDGLIAATALVSRLTLVTRNAADFGDVPIRLVNPWDAPPP